jgi:hypothetical protein
VNNATPSLCPVSTDTQEPSARALRYSARAVLWDLTSLDRLRSCGRDPIGNALAVRSSGGSSGFAGLETCGSVWACPSCSAKVRAARSDELTRALTAHLAASGSAFFLTLTMRHPRDRRTGQVAPLAELWDDLAAGWDAAKSGRAYKQGRDLTNLSPRYQERYKWLRSQGVTNLPGADALGLLGIARFVEATHGKNGWHLHAHAVLFFEGQPDPDDVHALALGMFDRWRSALVARGRMAPIANRGGLDIRPVYAPEGLGIYATKNGAAKDTEALQTIASRASREATRADTKLGRADNRTPWQVIAEFSAWGDMADLAIWREWEQASKGRRFAVWSRNDAPRWQELLNARGEERTDEEIAADDLGGDTLGYIGRSDWRGIRADGAYLDALLTVAASGSADAVADLLATRGIPLLPEPPPRADGEPPEWARRLNRRPD